MRHRLAPEADYYRLPEPPPTTLPPEAFAICGLHAFPGCTEDHWANVQQVYALAFAMLNGIASPSQDHGDLFFWN